MKKALLLQLLLPVFMLLSTTAIGQLSGTYTINSSGSTGGTNYLTFAAATSALDSLGVSGAVIFNVAAGTYPEQVRIPAITGASATNTITFKGLGASTKISFLANNLNLTIVSIDSASHIILDSLSIQSTGIYGYGVHFREADSITIRNCDIEVPATSSNSCAAIIASSLKTGYAKTARNAQYISLINNSIKGGKWGVRIEGMTTPLTIPSKKVNYGTNLLIEGNSITNFTEYGINASYMHNVQILGNNCSTNQATAKGVIFMNDLGDNCVIDKNDLNLNSNNTNTGVITLAMDPANGPAGDALLPCIITNNFIVYNGSSASGPSGIIVKDKAHLKIYNNTIHVKNQGTTDNCIWLDATNTRDLDGIEIVNNIFSLLNVNSGYFIYNNANGASFKNMDLHHNNFYNLSGYFQVRVPNGSTGSSTYSTFSAYQANTFGYATGDLNIEPSFVSFSDFHATSVLMNNSGIGTTYATHDIDGDLRSTTTPDMGADEYTPPSCPPVSQVQSVNVLGSSADIFWLTNNANPTDFFLIEYGPAGFNQGTGTFVLSTTDTVSLTGLMGLTAYDVYVSRDCAGSGNGNSGWVGPYTFTTLCGIINSFPFTETFDGNGWVPGTGTNNTGYALGDCWSQLPSAFLFYRWTTRNGATPSSATGPSADYSGNGNYIYTESNTGNTNSNAYLTTPQIDFSSLNAPLLTFQYHMYGATTGSLFVRVISTSGNDTVFSISGNQGNMWNEATVDLSAYANQNVQLNFIGKRGNGSTGDIAIDQIHLSETPLCDKPTVLTVGTITANSVDLSFLSTGTKFVVEYGLSGFTQGAGMFDTVYTNPATVSGLTGNTSYDFYIQNDCTDSANGFSPWVGPVSAQTICGGFTATYTNNWDHLAVNGTDDCWSFIHGFNTYSFAKAIAPNSTYALQPISSPNIYQYYNHNTTTSMMISPEFVDLDSNLNQLTLYAGHTYSGLVGVPHLIIGSLSSNANAQSFVALDTIFPSKNAMTQYTVYLNNVPAGHKYIGIKHGNNTGYVYFGIDDLVYETAPTCFPPTAGNVAGITDSAATVSWNPNGGSTWNIEYGLTGFNQATGSGIGTVVSGITSTTYTLNNLSPNTCYDVYIQSVCGVGDSSTWFGPLNFCTDCGIFTAPYAETFDGTTWGPTAFVYFDSELDNCWDATPSTQGAGTVFKWVVDNGTTASFSTGPNGDASSAGTGNYLYAESTYSTGGIATLYTPVIDFSGLTKPTLSFAYHMYGSSMGDLYVSYFNGTSYDTIHVITGQQQTGSGQAWRMAYIDLSNYNADPASFQFVADRGGFYSDLAIDEVRVDELPSCLPPMSFMLNAVSDTVAVFSWSSLTNGTGFLLEYGPAGFVQGTGTLSIHAGLTATLSNLAGNTDYHIYLADTCNPNVWVGPISFSTLTGVDAELLALVSPATGECGDSTYVVEVSIKNNGLTPLTNVPITVEISGGATATVSTTFTGSLGIGASQMVQVGTINNYYGGVLDVKAYTGLVGDQESTNDTLFVNGLEIIAAEPLHLPVDTLCPGNSGQFIAIHQTGITHRWYFNATSISSFHIGDTVTAMAGQTLYLDRYSNVTNLCGNKRIALTMGMNVDTARADYTFSINNLTVDFDASMSNAQTYTWDYGDASFMGTGVNPTHTYQFSGTYQVKLTVWQPGCSTTDTITKSVFLNFGVDEDLLGQSLRIYPNPSKGQLELSFDLKTREKVALSVVDLLGKTVYREDLAYQTGSVSKNIDLGHLAKGVYLLKVRVNEKTSTRRIVLQ